MPVWSKPRRIANGIMMNKPTVLSTGEWLLPCAVWACQNSELIKIDEERFSNLYISEDNGLSFELHIGPDISDRSFDEHMVVERKDKSIWLLVRKHHGIGESLSYDMGKTWENAAGTNLEGPDSRFFIRRLASGNLLLVNHHNFKGRNNLTAAISEDDGITRERYEDREILIAVFTEEDVLAGKGASGLVRMQVLISKAS